MTDLPNDTAQASNAARVPLDATAAAEHFFAAARDAGLAHVVLSPGSRSTALSVAVTRTPGLSYSIELDERVAGFVALGYAASSGCPVGLVCTSGTAAANYLPAVAEASMSNVPLIIITSDRPPEHQHWGVGQSFDQRGLYHRQVRSEITMAVGGDGGARVCVQSGSRSVATSLHEHGPVHVNWPFRLPIEPTGAPIIPPVTPHTSPPVQAVVEADVEHLTEVLREAQAPLIIAGPRTVAPAHHATERNTAQALLAAASSLGIPVLADVLSGLRGGSSVGADVSGVLIDCPALVITAASAPRPDVIIRLGHTPTAKAQRLWWEGLDAAHVVVDPLDEWQDPSHLATARCTSPPAELLSAVATRLNNGADRTWLAQWTAAGELVARAVDEALLAWPTTTEAHIARTLAEATNQNDRIVASSSMPVRDLDTFAPINANPVVLSNRGINGIDGVVSTAIGTQIASGGERTYALVGDVAALHDIGGILSAGRNDIPLTIVIPNNDGGGIFSMLPIRNVLDDADFNELFHTPHGTTFEFLADHPGITVIDASDLRVALQQTRNETGVVIIEIAVDTPERLALADAIRDAIASLPT